MTENINKGDPGEQGEHRDKGDPGAKGETGQPYTSIVTRHVILGYSILVLGIIMSFIFTNNRFNESVDRIDARARVTCQAGNERSLLAVQTLQEQKSRTEKFDFKSLAIDPSQASALKTQALESVDRQIASLPFLNCKTGQRTTLPGIR